ncbi:copper amine oxidase N-terminal domain-containing protein [Paenibacillus fonticola]|uniref:copper amine oxidase N-terminal domain-containing protein n=1 Tax=Paenibacillus fonticola TaxID=379896 RepID=UPI0003715011|nr:copper amine oxidase N-terminal domain-containing protein [Paenibacillus fonticola]
MNRFVKMGLIGVACMLIFSAGAFAATVKPKVFVHSNQVTSSVEPKIINGNVYVPIRAISEGFGADVKWDSQTKTVYVDSEPFFEREYERVSWTSARNNIYRFLMAYDTRDYDTAMSLVTEDFTTDIYLEFPTAGYYEMSGMVDFEIIEFDGSNTYTLNVVRRITGEEDYNVKIEKWKVVMQNSEIKSIKVVPGSLEKLDRYTVVPNASFGSPLK